MPRQGARKKQRQRAASQFGAKKLSQASEGKKPISRSERVGPAVDIEAALSGNGKHCEKLFELANRPAIRVAVAGSFVEVCQDRSTQEHSGGVVWETAFFLLRYLQKAVVPGMRQRTARRLRAVELGAGCGLLGLGLSRLGCEVVLTEQNVAMDNLMRNVEAANRSLQGDHVPAQAMELEWGKEADLSAVRSTGSFDLVVGSDIVFATRLVQPLILTILALLQGSSNAACWLCVQRRDPDAHALLLVEAAKHFNVNELSFAGCDGLEAACELECILLCFTLSNDRERCLVDNMPTQSERERRAAATLNCYRPFRRGDMERLEAVRVTGIPMPPAAWELVSIWSEVWDAPRFRAHGPAQTRRLSREAVMTLLKLAASCVAAIQRHLQGSTTPTLPTVPPHGASRELLVAAVDAEFRGVALSDPQGKPVEFVRELVQASFMTGDGEYADGMSEAQLGELLNKCCEAQLEFARSLTQDPTVTLQSAFSKLQEIVQQVLQTPPEDGDLVGTAGRWLLARQLQSVAEDAAHVVAAKEEKLEEADVEADESTTVDPTDQEFDSEVSKMTEDKEEDDSEPPLKRTKSQTAKLKVQKVKAHQEDMLREVHDLSRTTSMLAKHEIPENESDKLRAELSAVEEARRKARNFGEDLLEDMMTLDNLSGLSPEDRNMRKATLSGLESLLQNVDTAKSRLAMLHRKLEGNLNQLEAKEKEKAKEREQVKKAAEESGAAAAMSALEPPPPGKDVWQQVRLPLRFHAREESNQYVLSATVPGLNPDDVKLELNDDSTMLKVEGLRLPTELEAGRMRKRIAKKIRETALRSPEKFEMLAKRIPDVAADAYIELGQAQYGRFAEAFRLPHDVDVENIDASYTDGILRVVLPKRPRPAVPRGMGYSLGSRPGRRDVHPGLGPGVAGRWGDSLFGGHDDYFRW